jgi:molybdenum cofactor cytidylyltransferase
MIDASRTGAIVLAAGAGARFGGGKLRAQLDGKPVLQHVLDTVARAGFGETVVVLGGDRIALGAAIRWRDERQVVNPAPERGLASSVRVAFEALGATTLDAAMVLLGDQPRVDAAVIRSLLAAPLTDIRPIAVPRYEEGDGPNPMLILRAAWWLVDRIDGDRGLGPVLAGHPELVLEVPVAGSNPDIDTPADLRRLGEGR